VQWGGARCELAMIPVIIIRRPTASFGPGRNGPGGYRRLLAIAEDLVPLGEVFFAKGGGVSV
jgi:hypothetical protein